MRANWAVMISGRGSNLAALLELREEINLRLVVSSSGEAYGLARANLAGVAAELAPSIEGTKKINWTALTSRLRSVGITHVFLAGFMRVVPASFVADWRGRIVNLHPSLLPAYPGLKSIERAHADGAAIGLTLHEVNEDVDAGRVICRRRSLSSFETRGHSLELNEFLVHVDEQRMIKELIRRWPINQAI